MSLLSSIGDSFNKLFSNPTTSKSSPLTGMKQTTTFPSAITQTSIPKVAYYATPQMSKIPVTPAEIATPAPVTPSPSTPSTPSTQAVNSAAPAYIPPAGLTNTVNMNNEIANMQASQRTMTDINTPIPTNLPSSAMNPDNSRSKLTSTSDQLMSKLLGSIGGSAESKAAKSNLARVRNEATDRQLKYEADLAELKKNKEGKFGGYPTAEAKKLEDEYKADLNRLSLQENTYLNEVGIYKDESSQITDQIKQIRDLTGEDMVGSIQTDQATGNVYGYFRDPSTGAVSQRVIGSVSGGDNEQLSVSEAKALGVPFGTTKAQAYGKSAVTNKIADLSPQEATLFSNIVSKYQNSPLIKASQRTGTLKSAIDEVNKDPKNGVAQLALSYAFVQALDTYQSAVREGELSLINSVDSKLGQYGNYIQQINNGQIVRPEVAKNIAATAKILAEAIDAGAQSSANSYASQARVLGLGDVWGDYTSGFTPSYASGNTSGKGTIVQTAAGPVNADF